MGRITSQRRVDNEDGDASFLCICNSRLEGGRIRRGKYNRLNVAVDRAFYNVDLLINVALGLGAEEGDGQFRSRCPEALSRQLQLPPARSASSQSHQS